MAIFLISPSNLNLQNNLAELSIDGKQEKQVEVEEDIHSEDLSDELEKKIAAKLEEQYPDGLLHLIRSEKEIALIDRATLSLIMDQDGNQEQTIEQLPVPTPQKHGVQIVPYPVITSTL